MASPSRSGSVATKISSALLGGVLQLLENLLPARDHLVRGLEPIVDVHAELALRQIADVPHRGDDFVIPAQIFVDGLRLRRRLHHDQCL